MVKKSKYRNELSQLVDASYASQKGAKKILNDNYTIDPSLSSAQTKVFLDKRTSKPVVLHRGTTTFKDFIDDGLLTVGLGKLGFRYKNAQRITKKAEQKYKAPATAVGHSYGGWLSQNSGNHDDILTYNKPSSITELFKKNPDRQYDVRTKGDIISAASKTQSGNKELIENKHSLLNPLGPHFADNLYV